MGFVPFVTGFCILMFGLELLVGGISAQPSLFGFLSPVRPSPFLFGASGGVPIFTGRWWTVLSASWLHGGLLHILFNLMWIRQLAPAVGEFYGPGRMVIIYVLGGAAGFLLTGTMFYAEQSGMLPRFLAGSPLTVGASASLFALLGALVYYGNRSGSQFVRSQAMSWAIGAFVFGFVMPGIDNYAHAGGFAGGYLLGRLLDPLKTEQINHILVAVVLLALSVLSIIVSVIHGLPIMRAMGYM